MTDINLLQTLTAQLEEARRDADMWQRLKGAEDRAKRLKGEYDKAKAEHDAAEGEKAKAAEEARYAGLRGLTITEVPSATSPNVLSSRFHITYTRDAWDALAHASLPETVSKASFGALDDNIVSWMLARHPEKLPASILALAPGDASEALACYFAGLRRGYLKG